MNTSNDTAHLRGLAELAAREAVDDDDDGPPKLSCPACGGQRSRVCKTPPDLHEDRIRRQRQCKNPACRRKFWTSERVDDEAPGS